MKRLIIVIGLLHLFFNSFGQYPSFDWVRLKPGAASGQTCKLVIDAEQNVFTTSRFTGFPGFVDYNLTIPVTAPGIYLNKVDSLGNEIWLDYWMGFYLEPVDIKLGYDSSIYLAGSWSSSITDTVDIDPGPGVVMESGSGNYWDCFVIKFDYNGNYLWHYRFNDVNLDMRMEIGPGNEVYLASNFPDSVDCDPGAGTSYVTNTISSSGSAFICKISESGNLLWTNTFGYNAPSTGGIHDIELMGDKVLLAGSYKGTVDFTPSIAADTLTSDPIGANNIDLYLLALDTSGGFMWIKNFTGPDGSPANKYISTIVVDDFNNIFLNGQTTSSIDFNPDPIQTEWLNSTGTNYQFILKLDSNGEFIWLRAGALNTPSDLQRLQMLYTDQYGNVYHCGTGGSIIDLNIGPGQNSYNVGLQGMFISKLDSSGNYMWGIPFVQTNSSFGTNRMNGVAVDENGNVYGQGYFTEYIDFDVLGSGYIINPGNGKTFLVKYTHDICANLGQDIITNCDSYTWIDGNNYTASTSTPTWNLTNIYGCDSIINLDLTILNSDYIIDYTVACDSFTWINGITYTDSTTSPQLILTNSAGCDSIIQLDLIVYQSDSVVDIVMSCTDYTWIDGNTYTTSTNSPTITLTSTGGCDSTVTLNLTINSIDTGIIFNNPTLSAVATGAQYQWLDCDNSFAILASETNQNFTPIINGNYAVMVTSGLCSDTSACYPVTTVSLEELTPPNKVLVRVTDLLGRDTDPKPNTPLIYIYSDGTIERIFLFE